MLQLESGHCFMFHKDTALMCVISYFIFLVIFQLVGFLFLFSLNVLILSSFFLCRFLFSLCHLTHTFSYHLLPPLLLPLPLLYSSFILFFFLSLVLFHILFHFLFSFSSSSSSSSSLSSYSLPLLF